jgi:hypothetical protein
MGFSNQERINTNTNALQANVLDANPTSQWYEKRFTFEFALPSSKIYTELSSIPSASSLSQARTNASANPTIIEDKSQNSDAVRLTAITGTNDFTYVSYAIYNDPASTRVDNWLQPQAVPQSTGLPSNGYTVSLYDGDPSGSGTLITTTDGQTGSGETASVGWIWNYALGMLLLAQDFFTETGINKATFNPYVVGFRYIGKTATSGDTTNQVTVSAVCDESVVSGDLVRYLQNGEGGTLGRVVNANASEIQAKDLYISLTTGSAGATLSLVLNGATTLNFSSNVLNTDIGKTTYLSTTDGKATLIPPSSNGELVVQLGTVTNATGTSSSTVIFRPQFIMEIG